MNKTINFALIGSGAIAAVHAKALAKTRGGKLVGAYSDNETQLNEFCLSFGITPYRSIEQLYSDSNVDVINICTPSGLHAKYTVAALDSGKNVVVEKPIALTVEDCQKVLDAESRSGKICAAISQLRYDDTTRAVRQAIDSGKLGNMLSGSVYMKYFRSAEYYSSSTWRGTFEMDGGGALMNQGIHGIDLLLGYMGRAKSVSGIVKTLRHNIEVEDTAAAIVEFESGAIGTIEGTTSVTPGYPIRFELCGINGTVFLEGSKISRWDIPCERPENSAEQKSAHSDPANLEIVGHMRQFEEVVESITTGKPLQYTAQDAADTVRLICAIYTSSKTGARIELI